MTDHFSDYRQTMSCFATGVAVVTVAGMNGQPAGVTVNSFCPISTDPPLIMWSIDIWNGCYPAFRAAGYFAVNILSAEQQPLSQRFADPSAEGFSGLRLTPGLGGAPLLEACVATLECAKQDTHLVGEQAMIVGHVRRFSRGSNREPLIFCRGAYGRLQSDIAVTHS
jgi:flavin reductase (DIM6/NTAB) family NADH-FMN oxidoreductase RutF